MDSGPENYKNRSTAIILEFTFITINIKIIKTKKVHSIIWIWDRNKTYFSEKNDMDYYDGKHPPTRNYVDWKRNDFEADKGNDQTRQHKIRY